MVKDNQKIKAILSQVYILGGSPCSGKSTVAEKLSKRFHLQYYKVDDHYQDHLKRANPDQHPIICKVSYMGWNEIWSRPASILMNEEILFYQELFELILQDLQKYDLGIPIIVEGAALMPELVEKLNIDKKKVLYMVSTRDFQIYHYSKREYVQHILKECDSPEQAFENWMSRDHLFGKEVLSQAESIGYGTLLVHGERTIEEQFDYVTKYFGFL